MPTESSPTSEPSTADETSSGDESEIPGWVWWVLAIAVVGLVVAIPLVVRARRRAAWMAELAACEGEVAWFSRALVPELRATGSRQGLAGGWSVGGSARVTAVEDRLTVLESSASDETARARARALRDAVRTSRLRIEAMLGSGTEESIRPTLDYIVAELEAVLRPS